MLQSFLLDAENPPFPYFVWLAPQLPYDLGPAPSLQEYITTNLAFKII